MYIYIYICAYIYIYIRILYICYTNIGSAARPRLDGRRRRARHGDQDALDAGPGFAHRWGFHLIYRGSSFHNMFAFYDMFAFMAIKMLSMQAKMCDLPDVHYDYYYY